MKKRDIITLLEQRINTCYKDLIFTRKKLPEKIDWIEGFRSRLDELLLIWHELHNISFVDACKEFGIKYQDIDIQENEREAIPNAQKEIS